MTHNSEEYLAATESTIIEAGKNRPWKFTNEAEFERELFHVLSQKEVVGEQLGEQVNDEPSPRLQSEAKSQNGVPIKADLVVCAPSKRLQLNYAIVHIIELKISLIPCAISGELKRLDRYQNSSNHIWLASNALLRPDVGVDETTYPEGRNLWMRRIPERTTAGPEVAQAPVAMKRTQATVQECIDECLGRYGTGKKQYHSYFWNNFEHELERRHSFPCEGNFNAYL